MESFRFIHTGDIHLDSPLKGLSGQQSAAAERIRTATRVAFDNLVSQAIEEQVAFVIIAGDLYEFRMGEDTGSGWRDTTDENIDLTTKKIAKLDRIIAAYVSEKR